MQERRNSIANALELRLSCTNPSIYTCVCVCVWLCEVIKALSNNRTWITHYKTWHGISIKQLTSKVRPIGKTGRHFSILSYNINDAFLDEVHFSSNCSFLNHIVAWLENFVHQFRDNFRHKIGISMRKKWHRCDQSTTVVVDDFLKRKQMRCIMCVRTAHNRKCSFGTDPIYQTNGNAGLILGLRLAN